MEPITNEPRAISDKVRTIIFVRDGPTCQVCGADVTIKTFMAGHLIDDAVGGKATARNLVVMCARCNAIKPHHRTREAALRWAQSGGTDMKGSESRYSNNEGNKADVNVNPIPQLNPATPLPSPIDAKDAVLHLFARVIANQIVRQAAAKAEGSE